MKDIAAQLREILDQYGPRFLQIEPAVFEFKPSPTKWSKKEVVGHLIDSAHNNLRRFITAQYENVPKIFYDQDYWVVANQYQQMSQQEVVLLWRMINERICSVLDHMPSGHYGRMCDTGKNGVQLHTLRWLAEDYIRHLKHHMNQVIPGAFDIVYTSI